MTRVRSLVVRPIQSVDLAFAVSGVLASYNPHVAKLGAEAKVFDRAELVGKFGATEKEPGTIALGPDKIREAAKGAAFFELEQGELAVDLEAAISKRSHAFLSRFHAAQALIDEIRKLYPMSATDAAKESQLARLRELGELMKSRAEALDTAYGERPNDAPKDHGVVKQAASTTRTAERTHTEVKSQPLGLRSTQPPIKVTGGGPEVTHTAQGFAISTPLRHTGASWEEVALQKPELLAEEMWTTHPEQVSTTPLVEFRHPSLDAKIEHARATIALQEELLRTRMVMAQSPNLEAIWGHELRALTLDVMRLQHHFLRGFLLSPIAGTVTAVYKDVGEHVAAGEPVVRVENDARVLVVGSVQHPNAVRVGMTAKITTTDLFEAADSLACEGKIVSVRSHDADNDEWELIVEVDNSNLKRTLSNGATEAVKLPLNYHFDKDQTKIELVV